MCQKHGQIHWEHLTGVGRILILKFHHIVVIENFSINVAFSPMLMPSIQPCNTCTLSACRYNYQVDITSNNTREIPSACSQHHIYCGSSQRTPQCHKLRLLLLVPVHHASGQIRKDVSTFCTQCITIAEYQN